MEKQYEDKLTQNQKDIIFDKVIFLDIDGVISNMRTGWYNWDIYAVTFIRKICELAKVKIVISSTWRYDHNKDFFKTIFEDYLHEDHQTPILQAKKLSQRILRGDEIKAWLDNHPEITKYLILDDNNDCLEEQKSSFRRTNSMNGIMFEDKIFIQSYFDVKYWDHNKVFQHPNLFDETRKK